MTDFPTDETIDARFPTNDVGAIGADEMRDHEKEVSAAGNSKLDLAKISAGRNVTLVNNGDGTLTISTADIPVIASTGVNFEGSDLEIDTQAVLVPGAIVPGVLVPGVVDTANNGDGTMTISLDQNLVLRPQDIIGGNDIQVVDNGNGTVTINNTFGQ